MFSYKVLSLALLLSIPAIGMDKQITPADALNSTLLLSHQFAESENEVAKLKLAQAELDTQMSAALARKKAKVEELTKKYTAKCEEICSLDSLKLEDTKKVKQAETSKILALETLVKEFEKTKESLELQLNEAKTKYDKEKTAKEKEHDLLIHAAIAVVAQRDEEIQKTSSVRDQLHAQLTKAKDAPVEQKNGLFGWGLLGL